MEHLNYDSMPDDFFLLYSLFVSVTKSCKPVLNLHALSGPEFNPFQNNKFKVTLITALNSSENLT